MKRKFYTIKEVSQMLGISSKTLYNYVYRKIIEIIDIPNHVLIPESELEKIKAWRSIVNKPGRPKINIKEGQNENRI